jgi:diguanylate cyclase (GGDEF)-like protein
MTREWRHQTQTARRVAPVRGIRGRLMVLALIAIVPLIVDRVYDEQGNRAEQLTTASRQARELAQGGAEKQNEYLATTRSFLQVIARSYPMFGGSNEACGQFVAKLALGLPWAKAVSVVAPNGHIVCSSNASAVGLDISDRPHFREAIRTGDVAVSEYLYGRRLTVPSLFASYPQFAADGTLEAVASMMLDLSWIKQSTNALAERSGSVVLMIDGKGTVVARQPDHDKWVGQQFKDHPLVREMLARSEGAVTKNGLDGVRRIYGFVQLPGTDSRLAVGLDEKEVLRRVNAATWYSYSQLGFIAVLVLIGIWLGGERLLVHPIHALVQTAKRLGQGERHEHMADKPWPAEFVPLAAAFDDMAGQLAAREYELRAINDRLKDLAQIDGLTGIANRRTFDAWLQSAWLRAAATEEPLALLMIDIDHFKRLNDHYGHPAGDACLQTLAKAFAASVNNSSDLAARFGGEEFVVLLPGTDLDGAVKVAERVRAAVENLGIGHAASPLGYVTVSVGVASAHPRPDISPRTLIEAADANLYEAKHRGRNTVVSRMIRLAATG